MRVPSRAVFGVFRRAAVPVGVPPTGKGSTDRTPVRRVWYPPALRHRGHRRFQRRYPGPDCGQPHARDHLANHRQNHGPYPGKHHRGGHLQNALSPLIAPFAATQNVSQTAGTTVILGVMQRTKLDPKHVRDFFYRHALSVRLMTIFFDGIWWLIARGYRGAVSGPTRLVRSWLPVRLPVDERRRQLHR